MQALAYMQQFCIQRLKDCLHPTLFTRKELQLSARLSHHNSVCLSVTRVDR